MGHAKTGQATKPRLNSDSAKTVAATLQALATPSRLLILATLQNGPRTVGELTDTIGMEQSAVSHQLRHLRDLGLVSTERQGRHIIYRLYDTHVAELIDQALYHAEHVRLGAVERASDMA
jgi:ArsR family transcriptional regulator, nickel/cobalt-responsive transcriptional repressor